jgi:hypothetical protein
MTTFAVTSVSPLPGFHLLPHGLEIPLNPSTPTETQSISENDFECLASTGVNTLGTMFPDSGRDSENLPPAASATFDFKLPRLAGKLINQHLYAERASSPWQKWDVHSAMRKMGVALQVA